VSIDAPPLIINAALTGMVPTKDDNPALPVTPEEIAEDASKCVQAGASIVQLHARDEDGRPTYRKEVNAEIIAAVRERCEDAVVCVSTTGAPSRHSRSAPRCSSWRTTSSRSSRR
jgi:3-oxoadipate:acetyl-CoA acetyltransferase